jgi:hypothetical protein
MTDDFASAPPSNANSCLGALNRNHVGITCGMACLHGITTPIVDDLLKPLILTDIKFCHYLLQPKPAVLCIPYDHMAVR